MKPKPESEEVIDGIAEDEELHSLTHYAGDEELLVKHLFAAIQHTKLEAMMPPVLKAIPLQDLQLLCVHELRGISKKRIIAIIQGRNMSDSSGSEDEEEEREEQLRQATKSVRQQRRKASSKAKDSPDPSKPMDIVELEMRARLIQTMLKKDPKNKTIPPLDDIKAQIKSEPLSDRSYSSSRSASRSRSRSYSSRNYSRSSSTSRSRSSSYSDSEGHHRKRRSSRRSRRRDRRGRRRKSYQDSSKKRDSSRDDSAATPEKTDSGDKRRQAKKTRISRKEFEDRMRRAKENRTYRKRTDSEDETQKGKERKPIDVEDRSVASRRSHEKAKDTEEKAVAGKERAEEESEKEEGEIDSNEDEDADARYSGEGSPRRKKSHRSRSFSSISSLSDRSRSGRRSKRGKDKRHKRRKEHRTPVDKNLILATLKEADSREASSSKKSRSKAGIEAVDSEEDFDSLGNGTKREVIRPDVSVGLRTDRSNVSFSFNKKPAPSLMSGTDFEFGLSYSAPPPSGPLRTPSVSQGMKKSAAGDQIVISSDSEAEGKSTKKARKNSADNPMFIEDDANDGAINISDQNDLKLCEETVMKDIFDDMEEDEEEEEQSNKANTRTDVAIKSEPTDHTENDDVGNAISISRSENSGLSGMGASVSVKRELDSPEESRSIDSASKKRTLVAQGLTKEQDSEEGACSDEDSNDGAKTSTPRSFVNSLRAASGNPKDADAADQSYPPSRHDVEHKKTNGHVINNASDEEEEDAGLVDLPEDEHFALDMDDEDSNSQSKYDDTIDPTAEGGDDSEVTADKTDFYRGVENLSVSEDNSISAPHDSQMPAESEQKSESEEEGEIDDDAGLVELEPGEAEELSGLGAPSSVRPRVHQGGTEIIGEIEPSKDAAGLENLSESGSSWSSRWLQSEKVQKVVTNSKMLSRMRKRIKIDKINAKAGASAASAAETAPPEAQKTEQKAKDDTTASAGASSAASVPVINSMEEYKKLLGKTEAADGAASATSDTGGAAAAGGSEKKDEDDEGSSDDSDEDLWSKMMGN